MLMRVINSCQDLKEIIDETLRLNCPVDGSLLYQVLEDIIIWKVPIPKDSLLRINYSSLHFDTLEWHSPKEFIPERFNPESKFYTKPNSQKQRKINTFMPFGVGDRNCPGKSMSNLILKVIIAIIIDRL